MFISFFELTQLYIPTFIAAFFPVLQTSISVNADGLHDAAPRKIDHIALPTEYNYEAMSVG